MKTLETILLGLLAWCFISAIAALVVGRIIALGQQADTVAERLEDVKVDAMQDAPELFV